MLKFWTYTTMIIAMALSIFGVLIIAYAGKTQSDEVMRHFMMQGMFLAVAVVGAAVLYRIDYRWYLKPQLMWTIAGLMIFALVLVITPGIGRKVNGSMRWIRLGPLSVQPVEFVKLMMILFLAAYYETIGGRVLRWKQGAFIPAAVVGTVAFLLVCQPDFGGTMILCFLVGVLMLLAGVGFGRCCILGTIAAVAVGALLLMNPNRRQRLMDHQKDENYQAKQSCIAFQNGGAYGVGLGQGMQKENYLPECHTDFIFAVIAEDFGLVATASIWTAFLLLLCGGSVVAFRAKDKQGMLLAFGSTMLICVQGVSNMAVTTNVFPTKGLALPFLSYGGSCLLSSVFAVGVILGVGRKTIELENEDAERPTTQKVVSFD
ncbi:MAG: cell division protein FtsW [Kiritimatiellae bacterium]|nr:cell division protein FtsW [Kiritimatiellia bacterium]MBR4946503.1 cell division protein FtsW [Kiritimatiellia bacterium]MBR5588148.1 cell division protein FtsW [Kiritimatiellia bacterium]